MMCYQTSVQWIWLWFISFYFHWFHWFIPNKTNCSSDHTPRIIRELARSRSYSNPCHQTLLIRWPSLWNDITAAEVQDRNTRLRVKSLLRSELTDLLLNMKPRLTNTQLSAGLILSESLAWRASSVCGRNDKQGHIWRVAPRLDHRFGNSLRGCANYETNSSSQSVNQLYNLSCRGLQGAGADPRYHCFRGSVHPGQITCLSETHNVESAINLHVFGL